MRRNIDIVSRNVANIGTRTSQTLPSLSMALTAAQANMLLESLVEGAAFDRTATIGRQTNYLGYAPTEAMQRFPRLAGIDASILEAAYAEPFLFKILGASEVDSFDISQYEGATILHDLNTPLPTAYHARYDAVIEGGSLEHVFNFPVALVNCMKMLKLGGSLFLSLPVNNFAGHGFYQFSPELFFRVFNAQNGFALKSVVLAESWLIGIERGVRFPLYQVSDPASTGGRVNLVNSYPTFALVHTVRTGNVPETIFVQQSDYVDVWAQERTKTNFSGAKTAQRTNTQTTNLNRLFARRLLRLFPRRWELWFRAIYERHFVHSLGRKRLFTPIDLNPRGDSGGNRNP